MKNQMKQTSPTHSQKNHSRSEPFFDKASGFNDTEAVQKTEDPFFTQNPQNAFFNKTNTTDKIQTTLTDSKTLIQKLAIKKEAPELTEPMLTRFREAYEKFNTEILSASPLTQGDQNQVLIYGVSQASHGMKDYASTVFYIGNNGYTGSEDYTQFSNLWDWLLDNDIPTDVSARIV